MADDEPFQQGGGRGRRQPECTYTCQTFIISDAFFDLSCDNRFVDYKIMLRTRTMPISPSTTRLGWWSRSCSTKRQTSSWSMCAKPCVTAWWTPSTSTSTPIVNNLSIDSNSYDNLEYGSSSTSRASCAHPRRLSPSLRYRNPTTNIKHQSNNT